MAQFVDRALMPMGTVVADATGQIVLVNSTQINLQPGAYFVVCNVSVLLRDAGFIQVTPSYGGSAHLELSIYFMTNARSSAAGSTSFIIETQMPTQLTFTYNSNVTNSGGDMTVVVIKLQQNQ